MENFMKTTNPVEKRKYRRIGTFSQSLYGFSVSIDPGTIKDLAGNYELCIVENPNAHSVYRASVKEGEK
jgi:hypothetical protein